MFHLRWVVVCCCIFPPQVSNGCGNSWFWNRFVSTWTTFFGVWCSTILYRWIWSPFHIWVTALALTIYCFLFHGEANDWCMHHGISALNEFFACFFLSVLNCSRILLLRVDSDDNHLFHFMWVMFRQSLMFFISHKAEVFFLKWATFLHTSST